MLSQASLKEQLSERELKVYELELYVNELNAQIKELCDAKEKLTIANRNSRTLEEENSNLIVELKGIKSGKIDPSFFPAGVEAAKIIKENSELRERISDLESGVQRSKDVGKEKETDLEKQLYALKEDRSRLTKESERQIRELNNSRRKHAELQRALDEERDTAKAANEVWSQERERYNQKIDDLLAATKRAERMTPMKEARPKEAQNDLQLLLLKEDVEQLEKKLKTADERLWSKEKEWLQKESELKQELADSRQTEADPSSDKEVYRALQSQIAALKGEIVNLRSERRSSRPAPYMPMPSELSAISESPSNITSIAPSSRYAGRAGRSGGPGGLSGSMMSREASVKDPSFQQVNALTLENSGLRDQIDDMKTKLLEAQLSVEEKNVRVKELEILLAAANAKRGNLALMAGPAGVGNTGSTALVRHGGLTDGTTSERSHASTTRQVEREVTELRRRVRELNAEISKLKAAQEQKDTINGVRVKECQGQIDDLLHENEKLRQKGSAGFETAAHHSIADGEFPDHFMTVVRLSKDKRDCVEDVMKLLEASWAEVAEAMRQAREAKFQCAAMASQNAMKDEEIRRLQRMIDDLQDRLNAAEADRDELERLKDDLDDMRHRNRELEDEIAALKKKLRDEGKLNDKDRNVLEKEIEALKRKIQDLEGALADMHAKDRDREAMGRDKDAKDREAANRMNDLQRQLKALKDENSRLQRQSARSPRRDWPVVVRSPERALSQLSVRSSEGRKRNAIPEGAHLAVTVVELSDVMRGGRPITEPGYIIIKLKSIKEKYKTSVKELSSVIRFDESFEFYLAQPDQDVITLHVFYKPKDNNREYHIGDACFSMATLYRGIPRTRIAPVAQNPGSRDARRAAQIEVNLQTDDFGKMIRPTEKEIEDETLRFNEMANRCETSAPEKLHAVDVYMASSELM